MARQEGKVGIEKFNGTYFEYLKMQIKDYLYGNKLHLPLLGEQPDLILGEKVCRRDFGEASCSSPALNLEIEGRKQGRKSYQGILGSEKGRSKSKSSK
jgi:hypothetical protein